MAAQTIAFWDFPKPIIAAVNGRGLLTQRLPLGGPTGSLGNPVADPLGPLPIGKVPQEPHPH